MTLNGKLGIIVSITIFLTAIAAASPYIGWNKTFKTDPVGGKLFFVEEIPDGYILAGSTSSYGSDEDFWLIKIDTDGNEVWNRTYDGRCWDILTSFQQTSDGFILAGITKVGYTDDENRAGYCEKWTLGFYEPWLIKVDSEGNKEWDVSYERFHYVAESVQQTSDGYIIAGSATGGDLGWLMKVDEKGNVEWERTFKPEFGLSPEKNNAEFNYVRQTSDGFILVGHAKIRWMARDDDVWVVKTDFNGNEVWNSTFGGAGEDDAFSFRQTSDGGYVIAGYTSSYGAGKADAWLIKINSEGNEVWNRTYGGEDDDYACCVEEVRDGYVIVGFTRSNSIYAWLIKTDRNGKELWNMSLGKGEATSLVKVKDGYVIAGYNYLENDSEAWLVKIKDEKAIPGFEISLAVVSLGITVLRRRL